MKRNFACLLLMLTIVAAGVSGPIIGKAANFKSAAQVGASGWSVSVVQTSRPERPEYIYYPAPGIIEEKNWLQVTAAVTPPASNRNCAVKEINLTGDDETSYPLQAVAYTAKPNHTAVFMFIHTAENVRSVDAIQKASSGQRGTGEVAKRDSKFRPSGVWATIYRNTSEGFVPVGYTFFEGGNVNKPVLSLDKGKEANEVLLRISKKGTVNINLLFAVPAEARGLHLRVGESLPAPVNPAP